MAGAVRPAKARGGADPRRRARAALGEAFAIPWVRGHGQDGRRPCWNWVRRRVRHPIFAADLTVLEEGTEPARPPGGRAHRRSGAVLPMITSCSPAGLRIKHIEHAFRTTFSHPSTCKSPHAMLGRALVKLLREKLGMDPKGPLRGLGHALHGQEVRDSAPGAFQPGRRAGRGRGADHTRAGPDDQIRRHRPARCRRGTFDAPLGLSAGAADIFGVTGGVMKAALRTVCELVTGRELPL